MDLFNNYHDLSVESVVLSSKHYRVIIPTANGFDQDLDHSMAYYTKKVEPKLYRKVCRLMYEYSDESHGDPLFLKLLLNRLLSGGETTLKRLNIHLRTYSIKKDCLGKNVEKIAETFQTIIEQIYVLNNKTLPAESVSNLLHLFSTSSVNTFNQQFELKKNEVRMSEAEALADLDSKFTTSSKIKNDLASAKHVCKIVTRLYLLEIESGTWTGQLQKTPEKSGFFAQEQPDKFQDSHDCNVKRGGGDQT